jgi:phospholipid transport system substrate-binding protein
MKMWMGLVISAAWLVMPQGAVAAPPVGPQETVESAVVQVLKILKPGEVNATPTADRSVQVRTIARELFDFDEISRHALGRHWQTLTPAEQAEFVVLFRDLLERSYMGQLEGYGGEQITFVGESVDGDSATVRSKVVTKRGTEIPLDYRMHARDERWLVHDVQVGGMSFVASYRSQFDRVIRAESYGALRGRLQKKSLDTAVAERQPEGS